MRCELYTHPPYVDVMKDVVLCMMTLEKYAGKSHVQSKCMGQNKSNYNITIKLWVEMR